MSNIRIGTCGWADPTLLKSGFYPRESKTARSRLEYYSSQFNIVEVDSSYYAMPDSRVTGSWSDWTPKDFVFDIKAFRLLTLHPASPSALPGDIRESLPERLAGKARLYAHDLPESVMAEIWRRFETGLLPIDSAGKLGVILFQFPPWFNPGKSSNEYLSGLRAKLPQYRPAVEFRNAAWFDAGQRTQTMALLKLAGLPLVSVDEPQGFKSSVPPIAEATADIAVIRFHGRNSETWEKKGISAAGRFNYLYAEEELRQWIARIDHLAGTAQQLHVLFNNCYGDKAVTNARQMSDLLGYANPAATATRRLIPD